MSYNTGPSFITPSDLYTSTAAPADGLLIGQQSVEATTGKIFRYSLAGGSTLVVGNLLQEAAVDTTYSNMVVATAAAAGATALAITNGTATITSAAFYGASLSVYTAGTIAVGDEYTVLGITGTLTTGGALTVNIDRGLRAAMTTSATLNMRKSPWSGVIQYPTTQTGIPVGVAIYPITNAQYGWVQTHGVCAVLSDGSTFAVGSDVSASTGGTAGAITVATVGTTKTRVGLARQVAASAKGISVFLQID